MGTIDKPVQRKLQDQAFLLQLAKRGEKLQFSVQMLTLAQFLGSIYFKVFTLIEAATKKSAQRPKKKLRQTLMTPKEAERAKTSNNPQHNPLYSLLAPFQPFGVFRSEGSLTKFFFRPCGHAASIWPKTAAVPKFLRQISHFPIFIPIPL